MRGNNVITVFFFSGNIDINWTYVHMYDCMYMCPNLFLLVHTRNCVESAVLFSCAIYEPLTAHSILCSYNFVSANRREVDELNPPSPTFRVVMSKRGDVQDLRRAGLCPRYVLKKVCSTKLTEENTNISCGGNLFNSLKVNISKNMTSCSLNWYFFL